MRRENICKDSRAKETDETLRWGHKATKDGAMSQRELRNNENTDTCCALAGERLYFRSAGSLLCFSCARCFVTLLRTPAHTHTHTHTIDMSHCTRVIACSRNLLPRNSRSCKQETETNAAKGSARTNEIESERTEERKGDITTMDGLLRP